MILIGRNIRYFKRKSKTIVERLELLVEKVIFYLENELTETVFLAKDYKKRTLIHIVIKYQLHSYLKSMKTTILLDSIWDGIYAADCDGDMNDFSSMLYLLQSSAHYIPGRDMSLKDLLTNQFKVQTESFKYWFQYRFRKESVSYIFIKDLFFAAVLTFIFQYINFQFLSLFRKNQFEDLPTREEQLAKVEENIEIYSRYNLLGSFFALTLIYSVICKAIFNWLSEVKLPLDKWTAIDLVTGVGTLICYNYTRYLTPEGILTPETKQTTDYYVVAVVIFAWLRLFSFFLVIRPISKLLMTLIRMLRDTMSFMFIVTCYLLLAASFFSTLFQGPAPELYGSFSLSLRTMIDYMLGEYENEPLERNNYSHSLLFMIHVLISNIFLLNYLIAILSTVYAAMRERGEFHYKTNKYQYIEKFEKATYNKTGLDQFVIYPPPLNIFTWGLIPFMFRKNPDIAAEMFSKFMYWIENTIMLGIFMAYLSILAPIIYVKMFFHLYRSTKSMKFLWVSFIWTFTGFFFLVAYIFKDTYHFTKILFNYGKVETIDIKKIKDSYRRDKIYIYNELLTTMKGLYVSSLRSFTLNI